MHHYILVLVPPERRDLKQAVTELMAPYDENLEVEPYEIPCYCIGEQAKEEAKAAAEQTIGPLDEISRKVNEQNADRLARLEQIVKPGDAFFYQTDELHALTTFLHDENLRVWREASSPYYAFYEETLKNHPLREQPDPHCEECAGTGRYLTTDNPKGEWDYWSVGYRRFYYKEYKQDEDTANLVTCTVCKGTGNLTRQGWCKVCKGKGSVPWWMLEGDPPQPGIPPLFQGSVIPVSAINEDFPVPYAAITPDGTWHEEEWVLNRTEKEEAESLQRWVEEFETLIKNNHNCFAVVCECHS